MQHKKKSSYHANLEPQNPEQELLVYWINFMPSGTSAILYWNTEDV